MPASRRASCSGSSPSGACRPGAPPELPAFRDLLGIEPDVTRRHFGEERPLIRRGDAAEYVEKNLRPLLAVRRYPAAILERL